ATALRESGKAEFSDIREREKLVTSYRVDPLIVAGWAGMLVIAFAAVLLIGATGFVIYAAATAERRSTLFGVLRALGFSPGQVRAMVWVDHGLVGLLGVALGTALGAGLGSFFLRFMEVTERGERVVPPFVLQVDWAALGAAYVILGAVIGTAVGVASAAFMRQAVGRALRWTGG
ncbi:MAG: FtsX-like permease family protein, partial [Chloroflexota bacterium]